VRWPAQRKSIEEIKALCLEVKAICSGFNFAAELQSVVDSIRMGAASLTSLQAQRDASAQVKVLELFINGLGGGTAADAKPAKGWFSWFGQK